MPEYFSKNRHPKSRTYLLEFHLPQSQSDKITKVSKLIRQINKLVAVKKDLLCIEKVAVNFSSIYF